MEQTLIGHIEESIKKFWDADALTDYKGSTLQFKDVARKIEKLHILFTETGIKRGDKIAICGRNSSQWCAAFMAIVTYGAIPVTILHEFKADNVHHIVNHSDARLLFAGDIVWENLSEQDMPKLEGVILINDFTIPVSRNEGLSYAREHLNELFGQRFPRNFRKEHVHYEAETDPEQVALLNYTSGTTSFSKGVMLPYRALMSNITFAHANMKLTPADNIVSMLPLAHMYGLLYEFLFVFCSGAHIYFLTRTPSPKIILQTFAQIKPRLIISVPLIIEKIVKKNILPKLDTPRMKMLLRTPIISSKIYSKIRAQLMDVFGGRFVEIIVGGASLNPEVEQFLKKINFPYTVGYGMTETAPLICYTYWEQYKPATCGQVIDNMEIRILSSDPEHEVGEIVCRGANVMLGYYKNPEATQKAIDADGWLHTGDMGTIDSEGFLTIRGRCKNMLLGPSGQNIYPEEIEDKLNNLPYVVESIVVQQADNKLCALIYPDFNEGLQNGLSHDDIVNIMEENRKRLNLELPAFSQIARVRIYEEEFEKTPKKSIKRFLYQE